MRGWVVWLSWGIVAFAALACVGDETAPGKEPGDEGGRCFPNGTCNAGLICASDSCVAADASSSAGASSSGISQSCEYAPPALARREMACGRSNCSLNQQQRCCAGADSEQSTCTARGVACPAGMHDWQCNTNEHCDDASLCCLTPLEISSACPTTAKSGGTRCAARCEGPELVLCQEDKECSDGRRCRYLDIVGPDRRAVGACL